MKYQVFYISYKLLGIVLCFLTWQSDWFVWIIALYLMVYAIVIAYASFSIQSNFFITSLHQFKGEGVALTFDDGPHPIYTSQILKALKEKNVKATFFLIGALAEKYPDVVKAIDKDGHSIGNHSYSHNRMLPFFRSKRLRQDYEQASDTIESIIGKKPQWIRPPFGATSPKYLKMLQGKEWQSIAWSLRSLDTTMTTSEEVTNAVLNSKQLKNGAIILLHDNLENTANALPTILDGISDKGTKIVPLQAQINQSTYENV